jgi:flagellar hook-length control protein FliK
MSAVSSSLPIFSANNPLAVASAPAPSPEAPQASAFSQMLKQRQQAQATPAAAPAPAAPRAPTTKPGTPTAPAAPKATQAPAPAAAERPQGGQKAEASARAGSDAKTDTDAEATPGTDVAETTSSDSAATSTGLDPSLGSLLAGLNLPAASTQAGGKLARGQAEAGEGEAEAGDAPGGKPGGEGAARGARRLAGEAPGARADRAAQPQGADAPAAKLLAEAADKSASFREVAAQVHGAADSARTDAAPASGALLAAGLAATAPSAPAEAPTVVALPTPVDAPEFTQALGVQVSLLAVDGVQQAELHLNPAEMGPISVQIAIDGTQAQVDFGADMASTRQLIESGLPELASALRDAGFTLTGGGVSQQARQGSSDGRGDSGERGGSRSRSIGGVESAEAAPRHITTRVSAGGVDLYA